MNAPLAAVDGISALVRRASSTLASAATAAEILEARDTAALAYDMAKSAARLAMVKGAHDEVIAKLHRAQADALDAEAASKRRLADEYDAAQERGEVKGHGHKSDVPDWNNTPNAADLGIPRKALHDARAIRDAEEAEPGIVRRVLNEALDAGEEPTRAKVKRAVAPKRTASDAPVRRPQRGKDAIALRVREAISALSGLPPPAEVVGFIRGTDAAVIIDDHLLPAARWLGEFAEIWRDHAEASD